MQIALHTPFAISKKELLAEMAGRARQAFLDVGLGEPAIRFTLLDTWPEKSVSAIDRVLKRYPEMERFLGHRQLFAQSPGVRMLSNVATGEAVEFATLEAIAAGIPRSYPFGSEVLHFHAPVFGERLIGLPPMVNLGHSIPGVLLTDNAWINGRQRALSAYVVVEVNKADKKLPPNPASVDAVIKACGKAKRTVQVALLAPDGSLRFRSRLRIWRRSGASLPITARVSRRSWHWQSCRTVCRPPRTSGQRTRELRPVRASLRWWRRSSRWATDASAGQASFI